MMKFNKMAITTELSTSILNVNDLNDPPKDIGGRTDLKKTRAL